MTEHELQASIIAQCDWRGNQNALYKRIFAVPNGQYRPGERMEPGLRPGVPDLMLLVPSRGFNGLAIELKVGRNKVTEQQVDWLLWLDLQGWLTRVVRDDLDEAMKIIEHYIDGAEAIP